MGLKHWALRIAAFAAVAHDLRLDVDKPRAYLHTRDTVLARMVKEVLLRG